MDGELKNIDNFVGVAGKQENTDINIGKEDDNIKKILSFFNYVFLAYIFLPIFLFFIPNYFIVSPATVPFHSENFLLIFSYIPISVIVGIVGLISVKLLKNKKEAVLGLLTLFVIFSIFITISTWCYFIVPVFYDGSPLAW